MTPDERQPLVARAATADAALPAQQGKRTLRTTLTAALACAAVLAVGAVVSVANDEENKSTSLPALSERATATTATRSEGTWQGLKDVNSTLELSFASHYEKKLTIPIGDKLYDRLYVENGVETEFYVTGATGVATVTISALNETTSERTHVKTLTSDQDLLHTFRDLRTYVVSVVDDMNNFVEATVYSRVVRRELRDLDDEDRTKYFDAVFTLYDTSEEEGRKLYGIKFHSAAWLVRLHLKGAADKECDHWHDDAGFLNHHVGITIQFENALRAIDGDVAAHYWDYTYDRLVHPADWKTNSSIFTPDYFGEAVPQNKYHVVSSSRFAYLKVMRNAQGFSEIHNPYGLLRSPWNTNPVPYVMRHSHVIGLENGGYNLPTCKDFEHALNATSQPKMSNIQNKLNSDLHGPIHIILGGHWNMGGLESLTATTNYTVEKSCTFVEWLLISKLLWREGFLRCPEACSDDTPAKDCMCSCPAEFHEGYTKHEVLAHLSHVAETSGNRIWCWHEAVHLTTNEIFDALCSVGHPGDMFTSAAPQDPIFWPLHGQADRYVQLLRVEDTLGNIKLDTTWKYVHFDESMGVSSDTSLVCDWSHANDGGIEMPHCTKNTTCSGHREGDVLPFDDLFGDGQSYTNAEFWDAIAPDSDKISYVYDKLTSWPGCENGKFEIPANTGTYTGKMD